MLRAVGRGGNRQDAEDTEDQCQSYSRSQSRRPVATCTEHPPEKARFPLLLLLRRRLLLRALLRRGPGGRGLLLRRRPGRRRGGLSRWRPRRCGRRLLRGRPRRWRAPPRPRRHRAAIPALMARRRRRRRATIDATSFRARGRRRRFRHRARAAVGRCGRGRRRWGHDGAAGRRRQRRRRHGGRDRRGGARAPRHHHERARAERRGGAQADEDPAAARSDLPRALRLALGARPLARSRRRTSSPARRPGWTASWAPAPSRRRPPGRPRPALALSGSPPRPFRTPRLRTRAKTPSPSQNAPPASSTAPGATPAPPRSAIRDSSPKSATADGRSTWKSSAHVLGDERRSPASISYAMQASAHWSLRCRSRRAAGGLLGRHVLGRAHQAALRSARGWPPRPCGCRSRRTLTKSSSPSARRRKTLAGLRSRWTMPLACAAASADGHLPTRRRARQRQPPTRSMRLRRSSPSRNSITR